MLYLIHNESSATDLPPGYLAQVADAIQTCFDRDFAPACGVLPVDVQVGAPGTASCRVMHIVDALDDPGDLAYHTVDVNGNPELRLGVAACRAEGVFLDVLTDALSHEVFETARNPYVNRYLAGPWAGKLVADEACDPVQGTPYREGNIAIANFTLPAWGDVGDRVGPWDFQRKLDGAFACLATGYLAFNDGTQAFGGRMSMRRRAAAARKWAVRT